MPQNQNIVKVYILKRRKDKVFTTSSIIGPTFSSCYLQAQHAQMTAQAGYEQKNR